MSGLIVVTADLAARYTHFAASLVNLTRPPGSQVRWKLGSDVAALRNSACQDALDVGAKWVWFIDDDQAFPPSILNDLMADHGRQVDIIAPLVLRRTAPFVPVTRVNGDHLYLNDVRPDGLIEAEHTGSSGMLISRRVLETVEPPWFELGNGISEDFAFCDKARAAGFAIHVDTRLRLGHITTASVWPDQDPETGEWRTGITLADGSLLAIPAAAPEATRA